MSSYLVNSSFGRSLVESIYNDIANGTGNFYQFLGQVETPRFILNRLNAPGNSFPPPSDSWNAERNIRNNMAAIKKIAASDIRMVVPYRVWSTNTVYDRYDDSYSTELQGIDLTSGGANYGTSAIVTVAPPVVGATTWVSGGTTAVGSYISHTVKNYSGSDGSLTEAQRIEYSVTNYYLVVSGTNLGTSAPIHGNGDVTSNALSSPVVYRYVGTRATVVQPTTANGGIVNNKIVSLPLCCKGYGYTSAPALTFSYVGDASNAATAVGVVTVGVAPNYARNLKNARFFVLGDTTNYRVYLCLGNNGGSTVSTVNPSNTATPESPLPFTTSDGYIWQYIGTIPKSSRTDFITTQWMATPVLPSTTVAVNGIVASIQVVSGGYGYTSGNVQVNIYGTGTGATATAVVTNGRISRINVTAPGSFYRTAIVEIVSTNGSGAGATARAVVGPIDGFGTYPHRDMMCNSIMFSTQWNRNLGEYFSGHTAAGTFFNVGIIRNPTKYNSNELYTAQTGLNCWQITSGGPITTNFNILMQNDPKKRFYLLPFNQTKWYDSDTILALSLNDYEALPNVSYSTYAPNSTTLFSTFNSIEVIQPDIDKYSGEIIYTQNTSLVVIPDVNTVGFDSRYIKTVLTF